MLWIASIAGPPPNASAQPSPQLAGSQVDSVLAVNGYSDDEHGLRQALVDLALRSARQHEDSLRQARALVAATTEADTLRLRVAHLEGVVGGSEDRHWLIESWEAVDQWVWSLATLVLTLLAVDISVD